MQQQPGKETKCGVCATPYFERNNYFYGKQFTVRDLLQEQKYLNEKRWLVNRAVLGWGVVCGLEVRWEPARGRLVVGTGMALDCCGREIVVCEEQSVEFEQYEEACRRAGEQPHFEGRFVLCLEYYKCKTEPVELPPLGCDKQGRTEYNRIREGFKLRLKPYDEACPKQPYGEMNCLDRYKRGAADAQAARSCRTPTIHEHLCTVLRNCHGCEACDCVVLATIYVRPRRPGGPAHPPPQPTLQQRGHDASAPPTVGEGYGEPQSAAEQPGYDQQQSYGEQPDYAQHGYEQPGGPPFRVDVDACTDRRFVYNNSLLYDLIYCHHGDLPHVVDVNWRTAAYPSREISWEAFVQLMNTGLTVYFDQEMAPASLNRHTFFLTFFDLQDETGTFLIKRIPAEAVRTGRQGDCFTATFVPDRDWVNDELNSRNSELAVGVDVEITLRGSRIWSTRGKALDGDFLADRLPTGNGTQGGDFVDWFRVRPRGAEKQRAEAYQDF